MIKRYSIWIILSSTIACSHQMNATTSLATSTFLSAFASPNVTEQDLIALLDIADVNIHEKNNARQTALMLASMYNYTDLVNLLIKNGINVNAQDTSKRTALMFAAQAGNPQTVTALIKAGAVINAHDANGKAAIDYASKTIYPYKSNSLKAIPAMRIKILISKALHQKGQTAVKKILAQYKDS